MPVSALLFAVLAGVAVAIWTICLKLGSSRINPVLGAMIVTAVAFTVNSVVGAVMKAQGQEIAVTRHGVYLLIAAGIAGSGVDIFALLAYGHGLRVSSSLVITATSASIVLAVGFLLLAEPFTWLKLFALVLIAAGILLLQAQGG